MKVDFKFDVGNKVTWCVVGSNKVGLVLDCRYNIKIGKHYNIVVLDKIGDFDIVKIHEDKLKLYKE